MYDMKVSIAAREQKIPLFLHINVITPVRITCRVERRSRRLKFDLLQKTMAVYFVLEL